VDLPRDQEEQIQPQVYFSGAVGEYRQYLGKGYKGPGGITLGRVSRCQQLEKEKPFGLMIE
jgi:hypothetical protein